ncbi:hypothetical protein BD770DRAFT_440586 [Pilaira anomala]|nr:hypothetical protein BD770DRAFT_440586 [Pilaira anomala]
MEIVFWKCPSYVSDLKEQLDSNKECKNEHYITISHFIDKLYCAFKKGRSCWDENKLILELAVSNFIRVLVNFIVDCYQGDLSTRNLDKLNYVCIVPTEWDNEIREELLRPIFIQSGLIKKTDHKDRLLFLSDTESFFYYTQRDTDVRYDIYAGNTDYFDLYVQEDNEIRAQLYNGYHKVGEHYLLCKAVVDHKKKSSIHVHLIEVQPTVFNILEGLLYPKILFSSILSFTVDSIKNNLKNFLRAKLFPNDNDSHKNDYVDMIVAYLYKSIIIEMEKFRLVNGNRCQGPYDRTLTTLKEPCIKVKREWKLNETQSKYLEALSLFDICLETDENMINAIKKGLFRNSRTKQCKVLIFHEKRHIVTNTLISLWSEAILEYIVDYLAYVDTNIIRCIDRKGIHVAKGAILGARYYYKEVLRNSDVNSRPRILPTIDPALSSSVFLEHKINALLHIDILPDYTLLSCALVNSNGITEKVLNSHYFTNNKFLPPLELFYPLSEVTTLVMNERCIPLIKKHLSNKLKSMFNKLKCLFNPDYYFKQTKKLAIEFGEILNKGFSSEEIFISTQDPKYIEAFMLLYFGYINEIVLSGLFTEQPNVDNTRARIGYLVSMDKRLLNSIVGTKKHLKELVFESGLVKNNDEFKKLRIITQGEGLLPAIQKQIKLKLPIKSCFVLAQLHENHVQLTLNQVMTDIGLEDDEAQEAIILQDKIVPIENIYKSLCISMWNNIAQNTSLVQFCHLHCGNNENLFALTTKNKFIELLREFISTKIFTGTTDFQMDSVRRMELSRTCSCGVNLSVRDLLNISIKPFLYEMASIISSSLINREYFGNYIKIENIFSMIHFNRNQQFQRIFANLLKEGINDFNETQQNVDIYSLVLLDVPNQLLQPVVHQKLAVYKSFQVGDLRQISSFNFGINISLTYFRCRRPVYEDTRLYQGGNAFDTNIGFIVLKEGDTLNDTIVNRVLSLTVPKDRCLNIKAYRIKNLENGLVYKGTFLITDATEIIHECSSLETHSFNNFNKEKTRIPLMVFVETKPYSSSLSISLKLIGQEVESKFRGPEIGVPMTLTRS